MTVRIHALDASRRAAWDGFVGQHAQGTFFHQAAWAELLARAFGHRTHYLLAEQDGAVVGVLPLVQMRTRLFGHVLASTPFCVYGGPLGADRAAFVALCDAAAALRERTGATALELRFQEPPHDDWLDRAAWPARGDLYVTFRRPIMADDEANLKSIPRKQRAVVRKGIERGLVARVDADVDGLHRIYAESVRNLGTPVFSRRYFRMLRETFAQQMDVLTVLDAGRPLAAVLNFYWRDEVLPYYGGGTGAARTSHANDFMYWEVMRRAAARGARLFDFGRSKHGTGSFSFKKNWGFVPTPLVHRYRLRPGASIPDHNPLNPRYRLFIAAWKQLPLPLANAMGPFVVRGAG